jgi:predicted Zn-dependent protease
LPSSYTTPIHQAAAMWRNNTDFKLNWSTTNSAPIMVYAYDFGYTSWDGQSFMNSWTSTFTSGNFQLNKYWTDSYSSLLLKLVACHEFGHELSLAHVSTNTVMMYGSDVWVAYSKNSALANAPASDDINGINNRY